jgi:hypothetical protein
MAHTSRTILHAIEMHRTQSENRANNEAAEADALHSSRVHDFIENYPVGRVICDA